MANVPATVWKFLWGTFTPSDDKKSIVDWDSLAFLFLQHLKPDTHENSLSAAVGALHSLSRSFSPKNENSNSIKSIDSRSGPTSELASNSQTSLVDSQDGELKDISPPRPSSPKTPPVSELLNSHSSSSADYDVNSPEMQVLLKQVKALVTPFLTHLFPFSPLKETGFICPGNSSQWYLRKLSDREATTRETRLPPFPLELAHELANAIRAEFQKRTASVPIIPSRPAILIDIEPAPSRFKTTSTTKHSTKPSAEDPESPTKRPKLAALTPTKSSYHTYSPEATHIRLLGLEQDVDTLRKENALLKAQVNQMSELMNQCKKKWENVDSD